MNAIQQHRLARDEANARILLSGDFDAFLYEVDRPIPHEIVRSVWESTHGKHGLTAFSSKLVKKWPKFARRKKLSAKRALYHYLILAKALDYEQTA